MPELDRIKRNISKMIDQGAPEVDIDAYLGEEGVTADQLRSPDALSQAQERGNWFSEANRETGGKPFISLGHAVKEGTLNIPSSGIRTAKTIGSAIANPLDTIRAVAKVGAGGLQKATRAVGLTPPSTRYEPQFDQFTDFLAGRYGGWERTKQTLAEDPVGLGLDAATVASLGTAAARTGGRMITRATGKVLTPERLYQSALKPSTTLSPSERAKVISTGLTEEITPTIGQHGGGLIIGRQASGLGKLKATRKSLEGQVDTAIQAMPTTPGISTASVVRRADELRPTFQATVNPKPLLTMLTGQQKAFTQAHGPTLPPVKAQAIKKNTYRQMEPKYGEMQWGPSEVSKSFARGLKEELETLHPALKTLNARDGALIDLQKEIERAVGRIGNAQIGGIGTPITVEAGGALLGKPGAYAGLLRGVLNQPTVKSKLAFALNRARKKPLIAGIDPLGALLGGTYQSGRIEESAP